MRIWNFVPYCPHSEGKPPGMDIGMVYNEYMALVPSGDWATFMDHDIALTSKKWFRLVEHAIRQHPEAGAFVAMTNRLNKAKSGWQITDRIDPNNGVMADHRALGEDLARSPGSTLRDVTNIEDDGWCPLSGFFFVVSKSAWETIGGAPEGHGLNWVDWSIHQRLRAAGLRVYLIEGLYVYHWHSRAPIGGAI